MRGRLQRSTLAGIGVLLTASLWLSTACETDPGSPTSSSSDNPSGATSPAQSAEGGAAADPESPTAVVGKLHRNPVDQVAIRASLGDVVTGPDGTAHAVWAAYHGPHIREAAGAEPWSAEQTVFNTGRNWFTGPNSTAVGVDARGRVTVAWAEEDFRIGAPNIFRVRVTTRPPGGAWLGRRGQPQHAVCPTRHRDTALEGLPMPVHSRVPHAPSACFALLP